MQGLVCDSGRKGVRLETFPDSNLGPDDALIRIQAAGICGSDLPMYRGFKTQDVIEAGQHIIGHEAGGVIEATGRNVRVYKVGDRVSVYHLTGCGNCFYCQQGLYQYCINTRQFIGFHLHGGDADFLYCDSKYLVPIPEQVSTIDAAVSACAGGTAFAALKKCGDISGATLAVFGLGPVGLAVVTLALSMGATVIGMDKIKTRLEIARKIGCNHVIDITSTDTAAAINNLTKGLGVPCIIECSGSPDAQNTAIQIASVRGRAILVGHNHHLTIDPSDQLIIKREVGLIGSWIFSRTDLCDLLSYLAEKQVSFESIVSHTFPLSKAEEAFSLFDAGDTGKLILIP
jgi:propanol-preferring alcohol dehydrogenase